MATKVIYGTLIGATVGGAIAVLGNILRNTKLEQHKLTILEKYPLLKNHTCILSTLVKIYEVCATKDFDTLCQDLSELIQMEQENNSSSMQANRISEKCIRKNETT